MSFARKLFFYTKLSDIDSVHPVFSVQACFEDFLDDHKEMAFTSAFIAPVRFYLTQVIMAFNCLPLLELTYVFAQPSCQEGRPRWLLRR